MLRYDPSRWYWIVAGDESRAWSSAAAAFVASDDPGFAAWRDAGGMPTRITSVAELADVLEVQHPPGAPKTPASVRYARETGGIWFTPTGSSEAVLIATDRGSQAKIAAAAAGLSSDMTTIAWKTAGGSFVRLSDMDLRRLHSQVQAFVMACYVREAELAADPTANLDEGWPSNG